MNLFSSNECLNMPELNKTVLKYNSFWILTLVIPTYYNNDYYLVFIETAISIFSYLYWHHFTHNSIYHNLDKFFVCSFIIYIYRYSYFYYLTYVLLYLALNCFLLCNVFIDYNRYDYQLISHSCFRYFIFAWAYLIILDFSNYISLLFITIGYILHNYYIIHHYNDRKTINI